ncbi:MAG: cytochrome c biogenesis protein CcdA [Bacteroidales bacterium]|nr:cytochrome c biogenesis protein CcdA [Bacteroidales bacterium]MDY6405674.1 cytochrome c biogenesis protein CcdA [Bacteroidales bacterium]
MKRILGILLAVLPMMVAGQMVQPVKWSGEEMGDSVRLKAVIDPGFHMSIIEFGDFEYDDEYVDSFVVTLAKTELTPIRFNACDDKMCTAPEVWEYEEASPKSSPEGKDLQSGSRSLWLIFLLGLLGGLLAIFTPCVWPIIPMTVSFFLKKGGGLKDAILYGLSIVILYVGLGLLVTVLFGASALNEMSTNAVVNIVFFLILVIFALSFFGLFEITLPDSWSTALDSKARSTGGFLSILLMAFTLVIVSFSCTGPIIGTLLVEAAGKSLLAPAMGMLGFAIALALPFSLFAMFPQWLKQAPKSGDWMTSFKVVLAFLELALSLKFLSVADMAYGWGILPRWLFIAIWIVCFLGIGIYLLWNIRNVSTTRKIIRALVIIPSLTFAFYLAPGLRGAPVKAISAFAPPMEIEGREVFNDYEEGMAYARQTGKPIIIDFTGYGCVNCRKMEAYVLDDDSVKARLQNYVFIELFVDDKRDGIGDRNSAIQREQFGSNAQPFYVQLDPQGNQIAEPMAFTTDPMEFINWLKY